MAKKLAKLVFKSIIAIKLFALIIFSFCFESIISVNVRFLLVLVVNINYTQIKAMSINNNYTNFKKTQTAF